MAHAARITELVEGLVSSVVARDQKSVPHSQFCEKATKALRSTTHTRTNQFEIKAKLDGLVEKFEILNRTDLAEALQERLNQLPSSKWLPEILSLLLVLSDRPLEKTKLGFLQTHAEPLDEGQAPLTWQELVHDGSPDQDDLWADVERGYHSSGDDAAVDEDEDTDRTISTQATSVSEDDAAQLARLHIVQPKPGALDAVKEFADRVQSGDKVSELMLVRESLSMLQGLPTNIYRTDNRTGQVFVNPSVHLTTASFGAIRDVTKQLAQTGSSLNALRHWSRSVQTIAYLQSCQAVVQQLLNKLNYRISTLEQRYISSVGVMVSIAEVEAQLHQLSAPLAELSVTVATAQAEIPSSPFALVDKLYESVCTSELAGQMNSLKIFKEVLLAGLQTYLYSLSCWIRQGSCNLGDPTSLVHEASPDCDLGQFWEARFAMRTRWDGSGNTPVLLQPFANQVFALGKSRAFLRQLQGDLENQDHGSLVLVEDLRESEPITSSGALLPFSQVLENWIRGWLSSMSRDYTSILRHSLLESGGLRNSLHSLARIFCSEDGAAFQSFADAVFWSMDHRTNTWRNSFLLTELAQSTLLGGIKCANIAICTDVSELPQSSIRQLAHIKLEMIFSWPVRNITQSQSPTTHPKSFTLLLQIYRAKFLLRRQCSELRLGSREHGASTLSRSVFLRSRQRLLAVVDLIHDHVTVTAATISSSLIREMEQAENIAAMIEVWARHDKQLNRCLLLGDRLRPLLDATISYLELCEQFADLWKSYAFEPTQQPSSHNGLIAARVAKLDEQSISALRFVTAGVRSIARAGGAEALDIFAERLEWIVS